MRAVALRLLLLVPSLLFAGEVPRVPNLNAGLNATPVVKTGQTPVVGAGLAPVVVPGANVPGGFAQTPLAPVPGAQIPPLAPSAIEQATVYQSGPAPFTATLGDHILAARQRGWMPFKEGLEKIYQAALKAEKDKELDDAAGRAFFDGAAKIKEADGWVPAIPSGVVHVEVREVHRASDVDRLIPDGPNSHALIQELKQGVAKMAPYRVFTYHDSKGGRFTGIDLSHKPELVEILPEQQSHEVRLIKKIQLYNKDLQVVVREDGKTPDLVMGGMVTELKSLIGNVVDLTFLVNKANIQVHEHAQRHDLGPGAVAVDLPSEKHVPVKKSLAEINAWAAKQPGEVVSTLRTGEEVRKAPSALTKIYLFAQEDMKVFERQKDGSYAEADSTKIPIVSAGTRIKRDVHTAQFLMKKGRQRAARNRVLNARETEKRVGIARQTNSPVAQANDKLEAHRFLERLRKLAKKRRFESANFLWDNFKQAKSADAAREIAPEVQKLLNAETEGELLQREVDGPRAVLERRGIEKTVVVYGSARIEPGTPWYEQARRFAMLVANGTRKRVAIVTGGGPGIMEAANRGAREAGGRSIGHNIVLPKEQQPNPWQTKGLSFNYTSFSARKSNMRHLAGAHVYFPGGFGTMDELFELLTLMQTGKIEKTPIVLVGGREYWDGVLDFKTFSKLGLISEGDLDLFTFADDADQAWLAVSEGLR